MPLNVLIVGCGDLGCEVGARLNTLGHRVYGARRNIEALPVGIHGVKIDIAQPDTLQACRTLAPDILLYCVAAQEGSDAGYRQGYVEGLNNVLSSPGLDDTLKHVFFVSSTSVYGESLPSLLDENTPPQPADFRGQRLLEAEAQLDSSPVPSTILRLSGIYGPGRNRMLRLAQQTEKWPERNSWTNRIHRDDAAAFIVHLLGKIADGEKVAPCYIVTDSRPAPMHEVLRWLHQQIGTGSPPIAPPPAGGKQLSNRKMLASGFTLRYPDYRSGYADLLKSR